MATREELIRGLYNDMVGGDKKDGKAEFIENTNTLVSGNDKILNAGPSSNRHETTIEKGVYDQILKGKKLFLILTGEEYKQLDTLVIRESNNFTLTGNYMVKEITCVEKKCRGVKEGFSVVGFQ